MKSPAVCESFVAPALVDQTSTMASDPGYGSGRSSTPFTTLKIAVFAPMPSASVSTATTVKPRDL